MTTTSLADPEHAQHRHPDHPPRNRRTADELLDYKGVAALLTDLRGRSVTAGTIRSYTRNGYLPVPDMQPGGRDPEPGEMLGGQYRPRVPRPGELIGGHKYWHRSTIVKWNENRPGGGRWRKLRGPRVSAASVTPAGAPASTRTPPPSEETA
jgi:hypothetical protein